MITKEEKEAKEAYELMAQDYHRIRTKKKEKGKFFNEMLEMPATLGLLGDVKGKKILDWGCGSGIYAKILTQKGAIIKGFDISEEMLKIARKNNPKLDLRQGSGYNIPFKEKFDIVLASLAIHYLKDWDRVFQEVRRVLKTGGFFIFSVGNPVVKASKGIKGELRVLGLKDYFGENNSVAKWKLSNEKTAVIITYNKTFEEMIKTIVSNGFEIISYKDTKPLKKAKKSFPIEYKFYSLVPNFSVWKVKKK